MATADEASGDVALVYADIALAGYEDSLLQAGLLQEAVTDLIETPSRATLAAAKEAWKRSRIPYMQTEVFRFGNTVVDDWEGRVNAWPLDEGLIDYVAGNPDAVNVIANRTLLINGTSVTADPIDVALLQDVLHEAEGIETNVAIGYHAIEFLLWGQDLHGTGPGAGNRPATDFDPARCTGGNCERRVAYLRTATDLLVADLVWMTGAWREGGAARTALENLDAAGVVRVIVTGLGNLAAGELAGARMQVGLELHDPEEEHDCFSDNTHESHYWDAVGLRNVYVGRYQRVDGSMIKGPSLSELVRAADPELDQKLHDGIEQAIRRVDAIRDAAARGKAYDQLLAPDDPEGGELIGEAIQALIAFSEQLREVGPLLGVGAFQFEIEG
ncbi:MAG: peptidase [Rhodospirillales bacterium]|nr:peptidase [Rhodospirillales bacterium]